MWGLRAVSQHSCACCCARTPPPTSSALAASACLRRCAARFAFWQSTTHPTAPLSWLWVLCLLWSTWRLLACLKRAGC